MQQIHAVPSCEVRTSSGTSVSVCGRILIFQKLASQRDLSSETDLIIYFRRRVHRRFFIVIMWEVSVPMITRYDKLISMLIKWFRVIESMLEKVKD